MGARVLVVEDNPGYRNLYRSVLEPAGYEVRMAETAQVRRGPARALTRICSTRCS